MHTIQYLDVKNIKPAEWRVNYILMPDLILLEKSLREFGWLYPILAMKSNGVIIDGFHRWLLASENQELLVQGKIPVQWIDCNEATAMVMHVKLNRNRGSVAARPLSSTVLKLIDMFGGDEIAVQKMLGLGHEEFELLSQPQFLKKRKLAEHTYSRAWVPVEVPADSSISVPDIEFERPPSPDQ